MGIPEGASPAAFDFVNVKQLRLLVFRSEVFHWRETGWYQRDGDCSDTLEKLGRIFPVILPGAKLACQWRR